MTATRPQPQFADGPPVPVLVRGHLSPAQLDDLFRDLADHARVTEILEKGDARSHASAGPADLEELREKFQTTACRAAQVHYEYDGHEWTDTIFRCAHEFQVVRCQHAADVVGV